MSDERREAAIEAARQEIKRTHGIRIGHVWAQELIAAYDAALGEEREDGREIVADIMQLAIRAAEARLDELHVHTLAERIDLLVERMTPRDPALPPETGERPEPPVKNPGASTPVVGEDINQRSDDGAPEQERLEDDQRSPSAAASIAGGRGAAEAGREHSSGRSACEQHSGEGARTEIAERPEPRSIERRSRCCNAPLRVDSSEEGTSCYVCEKCEQPTGPETGERDYDRSQDDRDGGLCSAGTGATRPAEMGCSPGDRSDVSGAGDRGATRQSCCGGLGAARASWSSLDSPAVLAAEPLQDGGERELDDGAITLASQALAPDEFSWRAKREDLEADAAECVRTYLECVAEASPPAPSDEGLRAANGEPCDCETPGDWHRVANDFQRAMFEERAKAEGLRKALDEEQAVLDWTCLACGWQRRLAMPSYAGDGYSHYINSNPDRPCGPLVAVRAPGFLRARPGDLLATPNPKERADG